MKQDIETRRGGFFIACALALCALSARADQPAKSAQQREHDELMLLDILHDQGDGCPYDEATCGMVANAVEAGERVPDDVPADGHCMDDGCRIMVYQPTKRESLWGQQ